MQKEKVIYVLFRENYLSMLENSSDTRMFSHLFVEIDSKKQDLLKDGNLSCAYFVSSILKLFGLIKDVHATVDGTIKDMEASGWERIKNPKKGAVLVWEEKDFNEEKHKHIGFFLGKDMAISNSSRKRKPILHHWTYQDKRKVEAIFWHRRLDKD